jgi:hypothetical protein
VELCLTSDADRRPYLGAVIERVRQLQQGQLPDPAGAAAAGAPAAAAAAALMRR